MNLLYLMTKCRNNYVTMFNNDIEQIIIISGISMQYKNFTHKIKKLLYINI